MTFDRYPPGRYPSGWHDDAPTVGTITLKETRVVSLQAVRVETPEQVEQLRVIRNLDRDGYGTPGPEITPEQQAAWWAEHRDTVRAWLYFDVDGDLVGFGLVRPDGEGHWCPSAGVLPHHRGKKYGKWIVSDLTRRAPARLYAKARRANKAACRTHAIADWMEMLGPDPEFRYFRARFDPADAEAQLADGYGRHGFQWGHG